jgi:hypothetical protein
MVDFFLVVVVELRKLGFLIILLGDLAITVQDIYFLAPSLFHSFLLDFGFE